MKIHTIGGYSEVGKNMTVVEIGEDAFIFDMGLHLPPIVELEDEERKKGYTEQVLRRIKALPSDEILEKKGIKNKVRAILVGHAHLDHVGGIPFIGYRYPQAGVYGTPFTTSVLKNLVKDGEGQLYNKVYSVNPNSSMTIKGKSDTYTVEFLNMTHSTPQTSMIALHTKEGIVAYALDFKLDNSPVMGLKPNYEGFKRIAKKGVKALILDALYSQAVGKTPSETIARHLLEEVMLTPQNHDNGMLITTFSSHIARLKSIVEFGKKLNREIVFVGRSLNKYVQSAREVKLCPFYNDIKLATYRRQIDSVMKKVNKEKTRYLLVTTGHQGEPGSVMERISRREFPYNLTARDHIIFSSKTIPTPKNLENKDVMTRRLKRTGVRIYENVHVSGHGHVEDIRDLIEMVQPEHLLPSHGEHKLTGASEEIAKEIGYKPGKTFHLLEDGETIEI